MAISAAYLSYHKPELSTHLDKKGQHMIAYPCKTCSTKIHRPTYDSSCSNLLKHAAGCLKKVRDVNSNQNPASLGVFGGHIDLEEVNQLCSIWCAEAARPFAALADKTHKAILHPMVVKHMPLAKIVSRLIHMLYTAVQDSYRDVLNKHVGAMYLGADAWQSPNVEKDGGKIELESMSLDFVLLTRSHTGEYLAETIRLVVKNFAVQDKICGIVANNASNNASMVVAMKKFKWPRFKGEPQWIRCFAHILNLIVQLILRHFKKLQNKHPEKLASTLGSDEESDYEDAENQIRRKGKGSICGEDDPDEGNPSDSEDSEAYIGEDGSDAELSMADIQDLSDEDKDNDIYTSVLCKESLNKFRAIAKLRKSPNSKALFIDLCEEMECTKPHNIVRDVQTRWNSTFSQLEGIIRCEKAMWVFYLRSSMYIEADDNVLASFIWQKDQKFGLPRRYHIGEVDVHLARDRVAILQIFYEQTVQISVSGSARLTHIIVFIDEITKHLANVIKGDGEKYPPVLRNACRLGLQLTNKYYTLTDCSPLYRIAMDQYFEIAGWEQNWIDEALRLTREMFNTFYKPPVESLPSSQSTKSSKDILHSSHWLPNWVSPQTIRSHYGYLLASF
ncbi:hypothetical protein PTTG_28626 [Puccinia triticina 1-1 BBBD Race 1]|uniref:DUF659 domain-containing protein n=1 Tax=Puccinia triticina (isolate 1-1 / race 1 (BBBD)) TaxID=630390 RepID=A0A180GCK8_PUCT1|nr:hypothetical protein PTTG_28626 [Puccinia triticina 1-1 BBBD Race 1]